MFAVEVYAAVRQFVFNAGNSRREAARGRPPPPGEDLAFVEVLRAQALMLAMSVEAITPGAMERLRRIA